MKKKLLFLVFFAFCSAIYAQKGSPWKRIDDQNTVLERIERKDNLEKQLLFVLDEIALKASLDGLQNGRIKGQNIEITIPNKNGDVETFLVWESSNFDPELQLKYPNIRAYRGMGVTDRNASLYLSFSADGIRTMILRGDSGSEFVEPLSEDKKVYVVFDSKQRAKGSLPFVCKTEDVALNNQLLREAAKSSASNKVLKTLRLALSCTGEYAAYHGGTVEGALAAMNATMTRVNGVFSRDLAVQLNIIANNNLVIFTNGSTDPYSIASTGVDGNWNTELQSTLTNVIGDGSYDIGHLFGATGGGGNAGCVGCVCVNPTSLMPRGKGSAFTSPGDGIPEGATFDIDFVAHEMGHQLGANHTFSYAIETNGVNVEPGSGSTIMGYAGITNYDVQANSDDYFAYASIKQIQDNLALKSCPVETLLINNPPTVSAGLDYTIPLGTAFVLRGTGSDVDGNSITYCWEQNDPAINTSGVNSVASPTKTNGPNFRSIKPRNSSVRYMPAFEYVLADKLSTMWESVSTIARTLNFTLTARDNAALGTGQTSTDDMVVNVSGAVGPFAVSSQNAENSSWVQGTTQTVSWTVNNTNSLVGSSNVNIRLSTDGGLTFPVFLATNTLNDGSEVIVVPNLTATNCRILIEPTANIYYAINSKPFAIGYTVSSSCTTYAFSTPIAIPDGTTTYTERRITVPSLGGIVSDVDFALSLTHTYLSDVQIEVVNPQGQTVKLFEKGCMATNGNLLLDYDDVGSALSCSTTSSQTVVPFELLSAFNGQNPEGVWTLRVRDIDAGRIGTINSAAITICTQDFTLALSDFKINDFSLYPNPNKGDFSIQFTSGSANGVKVLVHDLLGRALYEKEFESTSNFNEKIRLKNVSSGLYLLTVVDGERKEVRKIVIE
jgi:subtilisin-like proprotein convertase family protein